jgi:hypothetical protein
VVYAGKKGKVNMVILKNGRFTMIVLVDGQRYIVEHKTCYIIACLGK